MPQPFAKLLAAVPLLVLSFVAAAVGAPEKPRTVVSMNLCTDQLLLALADPEQIASLSFLSRDPSLSFLADQAARFDLNTGRGEAILFGGADLVLAAGFGARTKRDLLERQGLEVLALDPWRSLDEGRAQIRALAWRLGHPDRGERMIGEIEAALARAKGIVPPGRSILPLHRRAWVPGAESLLGEVLRHMGFALQQDVLGLGQGGVVRLESVVAQPPDYALLFEEGAGGSVDNGSVLLVHPALLEAIPPERRLTLVGMLAICGGPATPTMIDALAAEVRAKVR